MIRYCVIRKGDWKAVRYDVHNNGKIELYDLSADALEENDIEKRKTLIRKSYETK